MLVAEGGATGRHGRGHPGQVHGHHIGVALHNHGLMALGDIAFGQIQTEQHRRLLVQHGFRGVDVLAGHGVVVEDLARAEADHLAAAGTDRPQQPPVEAVHRPAAPLPRQPRGLQLLEFEALAHQMLCQGVPAGRREAATILFGGGTIEVALGQILTRRGRLGGIQCGGVELLRGGIGGDEPGPGAAVTLCRGAATLVVDGVADAIGQPFDGLHKGDVLDLLDEGVGVAALAAAEAVEVPVIGPYVKRRGLLVVERAQPLERVRTRAFQLDVVTDDVLDPGALTDRRDVAIRNTSGHLGQSMPPYPQLA